MNWINLPNVLSTAEDELSYRHHYICPFNLCYGFWEIGKKHESLCVLLTRDGSTELTV